MSMLDTRSWFPVTGHLLLVAGRSMMAAGWWFLEISGIRPKAEGRKCRRRAHGVRHMANDLILFKP
jgi:hypothetical protein